MYIVDTHLYFSNAFICMRLNYLIDNFLILFLKQCTCIYILTVFPCI